jgi:hypothetical protein
MMDAMAMNPTASSIMVVHPGLISATFSNRVIEGSPKTLLETEI